MKKKSVHKKNYISKRTKCLWRGRGVERMSFADCGMLTPNMKMPLGFEWVAYPIDSLKPEDRERAEHEICALGDGCLYYEF